jgi:hypothetical protein
MPVDRVPRRGAGDVRQLAWRVGGCWSVADLPDWPGERVGHRWLLERASQLQDSVRAWDAFCVALAEAFDAILPTMDERLSRAWTTCRIEVVGGG